LRVSIFTRYLAWSYVKTALATLAGVVAVVLVVDFADRAYSFRGPSWVANVVRLYANLSVDLAYQVAPSALLLAAGILVSGLRQQGELTALYALGQSPRRVLAVVLGTCALGCALLVGVNEAVVVEASRKADQIKAESFRRSGNFRAYLEQQHWFRIGNRIYDLRGRDGEGFTDVSLYELAPGFRLGQRIDAARMQPTADGRWRLEDAHVATFGEGGRQTRGWHDTLTLELPETPADFQVQIGKPRQMSLWALYRQIGTRAKVGLSTAEYAHELHNRLAYPFAAVPGAFLALLLALRPARRGHLSTALAEGIVVSLAMFTLLTVFRALGHSGALAPAVAAWAPVALLALVGFVAPMAARLVEERRRGGLTLRRPVP
jgi:lipopolysaccharide export system permease protein